MTGGGVTLWLIPDTLNQAGVALAGAAPNKGPFTSITNKTSENMKPRRCNADAETNPAVSASLVDRRSTKLHN